MPDFTREELEEVIQASRKLDGVNLAGIDLSGADVKGADMVDTHIAQDYAGARYTKDTKFPDDFDPEEVEMVLVK